MAKLALRLNPTREELRNGLDVAAGRKIPDLLLKNATRLDVVNGIYEKTNIALMGRFIAGVGLGYTKGKEIIDLEGLYVVPGFIDAHVHIESSMMTPFEFERKTLSLGTTSVIADPHEITNVMGSKGFEWFVRCAENMHQNVFLQVSSCVPAVDGLETNGGKFTLDEMVSFKSSPYVLGLAEMMNVPGVIHGNPDVLSKIEAFSDRILDGHAPLLRGKQLNAYRFAGIANCHESITPDEALEKLSYGMGIMLREGSAAKNLDDLAGIISPSNAHHCMMCSDDRNPLDIHEGGHIDYMIRMLIQNHAIPTHMAYGLASYTAARHFGLSRLGVIAPGYQADFVVLSDLERVHIEHVYCKGKPVTNSQFSQEKHTAFLKKTEAPLHNTIVCNSIGANDFSYDFKEGATYRVIEVIPNQIITSEVFTVYKNGAFDTEDIIPIQIVERYGHNIPPSKGLVKGMGLTSGAIATSVAHDSHNIVVVGRCKSDRLKAVHTLRSTGGGIVVIDQGEVKALLALPIAGLMSDQSADRIAHTLSDLRRASQELGCTLHEPFLQLSFLALPVIPKLKITDAGLIRDTGDTLEIVPLEVVE
jgi:adenine deaminase